MASRPAIISRQAWENIECKNRQPHPATTTSRRWSHACKQPNTKSKLWVTRRRHELWAPMSQMWKQLYQNGCNHSRQDYRRSSNSTDVYPGDVETPPPVLPPSVHPPAKPSSNRAGGKHIFFTHFPKDPNCEVCGRTKVTRVPCKRHTDERADRKKMGERFGDMITADHKVLNEGQESRMHYKYKGVVQDLAAQWIQSYPCKTISVQETQRNLKTFLRREENPRSNYADNSLECIKACDVLTGNRERSTPH